MPDAIPMRLLAGLIARRRMDIADSLIIFLNETGIPTLCML